MTGVRRQAEQVEVILQDFFSLNYVITSAIALIGSRFIKLHKIPWKYGNTAAMGWKTVGPTDKGEIWHGLVDQLLYAKFHLCWCSMLLPSLSPVLLAVWRSCCWLHQQSYFTLS